MSRLTTAAVRLVVSLAVLAPATVAVAATPAAVLGADGELYRLEQGTYGELMGRPQAPEADNSVLVLRVRRPDRQDELHPLPATLGPDHERTAALVYEETSGTLFVAWEALNNLHSQIRMVGFSDGVWGQPVDVSDLRFSFKSNPRLAVTRDVSELRDEDDATVTVKRTVIHAVWSEERADGLAIAYSPLVLIDGVFEQTAGNPIFTLTDLITPAEGESLAVPLADLPLPPAIEAGSDSASVVVGFVHPASGRLVTAELTLLPASVSALAGGARAHIIDLGGRYDTSDAGGLRSFADDARAHIIDLGHRHRLDSTVLGFVADQVWSHVLETGGDYDLSDPDERRALGDQARAHIIDLGSRLADRGLRSQALSSRTLDLAGSEERQSHQIQLGLIASRSLDGVAPAGEPLLMLSDDGADAVIAWQENGRLRYQESRGEGWSNVRAISLANLDLQSALAILEHRSRNR